MKADLIIKNAALYSVRMDDSEIRGSAVAVKDGKILYVGDDAGAEAFKGPDTELVDAEGVSLLPAFGDGHIHTEGSVAKMQPSIADIAPEADDTPDTIVEKYKARIKTFVEADPDKEWYFVMGWDQAYFNGSIKGIVKVLSRKDLDEICPDKPMCVMSYCGHATWVNTKALEKAGWASPDFPDVPGGIIYREENGFPTGHLTEPAVIAKITADGKFVFDDNMQKDAIERYQQKYGIGTGMTMTCDMKSTVQGRRVIKALAEEGRAKMRYSYTYCLNPASAEEDYKIALDNVANDQYSDLVYCNTLKFFIEGQASDVEPYLDSWCEDNGYPKGYKAPLIWDLDEMFRYMDLGVEQGFNIHIHAMYSNAVLQAAKLCAKCRQKHPDKNVTYTIAHHASVTDEALKIMADNGIIANLQPFWMCAGNDTIVSIPSMFKEPKYGWFPNKVYEDAGITVAYGSDFPVTCPADPILGIGTAVTRLVYPGNKDYEEYKGTVYREDQCVTLKQALKACTAAVAYQFGFYDITGSLEAGKSADFVLLDGDIEKTALTEIDNMKIKATYFKGEKVYQG